MASWMPDEPNTTKSAHIQEMQVDPKYVGLELYNSHRQRPVSRPESRLLVMGIREHCAGRLAPFRLALRLNFQRSYLHQVTLTQETGPKSPSSKVYTII